MWDKEWWCVLVTIAEGSELQWWPPVLLPGGLLPFWNCGHSTSPAEAAKDNGTHTPLMTHQETQMGGTPYRRHSTCMPNHPSIDRPPNPQMFRTRAYDISGYHTIWRLCVSLWLHLHYNNSTLSYRFGFLHFDKHKTQPCDEQRCVTKMAKVNAQWVGGADFLIRVPI